MVAIQPVTLEQVNKLKNDMAASGTEINSIVDGSYSIKDHNFGVEAAATLVGDCLTVTVTKKPLFVPTGIVEGKIKTGIEKALKG